MNDTPLLGKTALVTGAGRRLGQVLALALARAGADLLLHYQGSHAGVEETAAGVRAAGRRATPLQADLTDAAAVERLVTAARSAAPALHLLVNSAAAYERAPLAELTVERWDAMLDLNLRAPYLLCRGLAPALRADGGGVIINIVDLAGFMPWANYLHYAVSKAGLVALTRCLALELAPDIRVNAVAPGTVMPSPLQSPADLAALEARTPLGRMAAPEDVAASVLFLAAGPASITGQVLAVDGGRSIYSAG